MPDSGGAVYHLAMCGRELAARDRSAATPEETARLCWQVARLLEAQRLRDPADRDSTQVLASVCWMLADSSIQAGQRAARRAVAVLADLADRHPDDPSDRLQAFLGQSRLSEREGPLSESSVQHSARRAADGPEGIANPEPPSHSLWLGG